MKEYCIVCEGFKELVLKEEEESSFVGFKEHRYKVTNAYCSKCNAPVNVDSLSKKNLKSYKDSLKKREF